MIKFPLKFEIAASAKSGIQNSWSTHTGALPPIHCAIPLEFHGPGNGYSPEDLFAASILNCLIAIFKVYCEKRQVAFSEIKGKVVLTVDRAIAENLILVTHVDVHLEIFGASDVEKARKIMDSSAKDCIISNSIKAGKTFHIIVH